MMTAVEYGLVVRRTVIGAGALLIGLFPAFGQTAPSVEILDHVETNQPEDLKHTRGVTDGKLLYVKVPSSIIGYTLDDLSNLEPYNWVDTASPGMQSTGRLVFDATDGYLYVLRQVSRYETKLHVYDARHPGVMREVAERVMQENRSSPWPIHFMDNYYDRYHEEPPMAIEASGRWLFCTILGSGGWNYNNNHIHFPPFTHPVDFPLLLVDISQRESPAVIGDYGPIYSHFGAYEAEWLGFPEALPDVDRMASKLVYREGFVFWLVHIHSFFIADLRNHPTINLMNSQPYINFTLPRDYFLDIAYSRRKVFFTTQYHQGPDANPSLRGGLLSDYLTFDFKPSPILDAADQKSIMLPDGLHQSRWSIEPLGGWIYAVNGDRAAIDSVTVFDDKLVQRSGTIATPAEPLSTPNIPVNIPFGDTGVLLRDGVTTYKVPGMARTELKPERTFVTVPPGGGRVEVPIRNGVPGPMRWYLYDSGANDDWCIPQSDNWGEDGDRFYIDASANPTAGPRVASFRIYAPGAVNSPQDIWFYQEPVRVGSLTMNPSSVKVGANRWYLTVKVDTPNGDPVNWELSCQASWVQLPAVTKYTGPAVLEIVVAPNPQKLDRTTAIIASTNELSGPVARATIRQDGTLTGDGVSAADIQAVINAILDGGTDLTLDVNGDGVVDSIDLQLLINAALGVK